MLSHHCGSPGVLQHSFLSGDIAKAIWGSDAGTDDALCCTHACSGLSTNRRSHFQTAEQLRFAKRSNQEKATPEMAVRYADSPRRQHRKREASETRCAQTADASLSDFGTSDVAPSTGIHCNGNRNRNCNGRCAGKGNCSASREPLSGRRLLTASMLTGLVGAGAGSPTFEAALLAGDRRVRRPECWAALSL